MNLLEIFAQVGEGMGNSILIFVLTLVFSLPLGLLVAFGRMNRWAPLAGLKKSKSPFWRKAAEFRPVQLLLKLFISILRGTPLMLQLMVVYYGPYYIFKVPITLEYQFYAVIIAFAVNYAAYFAEIYRSGIESMPVGQYEAAKVLGYNKGQTFFRIILPQVIRIILPPISNETITLVKDTSLVYVLAMNDLMRTARNLVQRDFSITPFIVAAVFYLLATLILTLVFERLEKRFSRYDQ
mgnify:CR=1 FL=1